MSRIHVRHSILQWNAEWRDVLERQRVRDAPCESEDVRSQRINLCSMEHIHIIYIYIYVHMYRSVIEALIWFQVKSRTNASGQNASGDLPAATNWRGITENTPEPSHSNARFANVRSLAATISHFTWSVIYRSSMPSDCWMKRTTICRHCSSVNPQLGNYESGLSMRMALKAPALRISPRPPFPPPCTSCAQSYRRVAGWSLTIFSSPRPL